MTDPAIGEILVDKWLNISVDLVHELVVSVPRRLATVPAANGRNEFDG